MEWLPIIFQLLSPFLAKCHSKSEAAAQDPKEYLRSKYDAETGKMDRDLVRRAIPATRKAIRQARRQASREERKTFPRYSKEDIYQIAEKKLVDSMEAPDQEVAAAFAAASELPDED